MSRAQNRIPVVCGLDIGSTNVKVIALDEDGRVVARARTATPRDPVTSTIDASDVRRTLEDMVIEVCGDRYAARALCSAGVGEDGVLVDPGLEPLGPALAWFDARRTALFRELAPALTRADDLGVALEAARTVVGWAWTTRALGAGAHRQWLSLTDHAGSVWAGTPFMSDTIAARTAAWDPARGDWIAEHVAVGLGHASTLPTVLAAGTVVGPVRSAVLTGSGAVTTDAVVVAGGHDHPIGGWAVDAHRPGAVLDSMGTAEVVVGQSALRMARTTTIDTAPGILHAGSTRLGVVELGRNTAWAGLDPAVGAAVHRLLHGEADPDGALDSPAFVPGLRGGGRPRWAPDAPTAALSRASAVLGALARAGNRVVAEVAAEQPVDAPVFAAGGWARSRGWLAIKRRLGTELAVVPEPEVTAVGAALLAAHGIGWTPDPGTALGSSV